MLNDRGSLSICAPLELGGEAHEREGLLKRDHLGPELIAFDFDRPDRERRVFARRGSGDLLV